MKYDTKREISLDLFIGCRYDAVAETAGYRDLRMNLRLETESTIRLGLDTHVCELQLMLLEFAHIKVHERWQGELCHCG